jgi:hypothetical protein
LSQQPHSITVEGARNWVTIASLSLVGTHAIFLIIAPALGFPLRYTQALRLLENISPVFVSFLASAVTFLVGDSPHERTPLRIRSPGLFASLLKGPIYLLAAVNATAFVAFGLTNRIGAPVDIGMRADDLSRVMSVTMSILMATSSGLVGWLFNVKQHPEKKAKATSET